MTNYNVGNWTVKSNYADTATSTKTVAIPDLTYAKDFAVKIDEAQEATIVNTTGSSISSPESLRFGCTAVANIYQNSDVDVSNACPSKRGVQIMVEAKDVYSASNTVTGASFEMPATGRLVIRVPSNECVTTDLVLDILKRTISACYATGLVDATRLGQLLRGALIPSGL